MTKYTVNLAAVLLLLVAATTSASTGNEHGIALRYFSFVESEEPVELVGVAYSRRNDVFNVAIELVAPRNTYLLETKEPRGELDFILNTSIGWEKPFGRLFAFRTDFAIESLSCHHVHILKWVTYHTI